MSNPLGEHPAQSSGSSRDLSDQYGHAGSAVGGDSRAGVEAEPTNPQHGRNWIRRVTQDCAEPWHLFTVSQEKQFPPLFRCAPTATPSVLSRSTTVSNFHDAIEALARHGVFLGACEQSMGASGQ